MVLYKWIEVHSYTSNSLFTLRTVYLCTSSCLLIWSIEPWKLLDKSKLWGTSQRLLNGLAVGAWGLGLGGHVLTRPATYRRPHYALLIREYLKVAREKLFVFLSRFLEGSYDWGTELNDKPWVTWTTRYHNTHSAGWMLFLFLFMKTQIE